MFKVDTARYEKNGFFSILLSLPGSKINPILDSIHKVEVVAKLLSTKFTIGLVIKFTYLWQSTLIIQCFYDET